MVELEAKFLDEGHVEGIESAVLIGAVLFTSLKRKTMSLSQPHDVRRHGLKVTHKVSRRKGCFLAKWT